MFHGLGARAFDGNTIRNGVYGVGGMDAVLMEGLSNCRSTFCLHTDDLNTRINLLDAGGYTGQQSAATCRNQNHIHSRQVTQDFQTDGTLTCHDILIIKGMNEGGTGFLHDFHCLGIGVIITGAGQHHIGAIALGCGYLGNRGRTGHADGSRNADFIGSKGNALSMVACGGGNNRFQIACLIQLHNFVVGTAHLKGAGFLLVLTFEIHFRPGHTGKGGGRGQRNIMNNRLQALGSLVNILDTDHGNIPPYRI